MFLQAPLAPSTLVVAIDPGKVMNRVWVSDGEGPVAEPVSMPVSRAGIQTLERTMNEHAAGHGEVVIAVEATGSLHQSWAAELESTGRTVGVVGQQASPTIELHQAWDVHKGREERFRLRAHDPHADMLGDPWSNGRHSQTSPERVHGR